MTREKAKKILRSWDGVYIGYSSDEVEEAHNMAIKALSQEPICIGKVEFDEDKLREIVKGQVARIEITAEQEPCADAVKVCEIYADVNDCENGAQELCGQCIHYKEPCDDAISREAVNTLVDELARAISDERCHIPQRGRSTGHIMHDILDLPSVTQSRHKGHWLKRFDLGNCLHYICSECENEGENSDYCPYCGAEMESAK